MFLGQATTASVLSQVSLKRREICRTQKYTSLLEHICSLQITTLET